MRFFKLTDLIVCDHDGQVYHHDFTQQVDLVLPPVRSLHFCIKHRREFSMVTVTSGYMRFYKDGKEVDYRGQWIQRAYHSPEDPVIRRIIKQIEG